MKGLGALERNVYLRLLIFPLAILIPVRASSSPEYSLEGLRLNLKLQYFGLPILWPSNAKNELIRKDPDAWRDWGQEEKGTTEMAGRCH